MKQRSIWILVAVVASVLYWAAAIETAGAAFTFDLLDQVAVPAGTTFEPQQPGEGDAAWSAAREHALKVELNLLGRYALAYLAMVSVIWVFLIGLRKMRRPDLAARPLQ